MKELRKPQIRFAGFTDDWEQRKLGEIVERVTRKNTNLESNLPLTISAQYGLISQTEFFDKQVASRDISGYYLIENGEFAYNKSYSNGYPWGTIKRLDRHKNGVLSTLYICFKPTKINSQFLVSYYDSQHWYSQMESIAVEGARNHGLLNIPTEDFFNTVLSIPSSEKEQTAIGNFFKQLDETIALHQREYEKYKNLKISYLEKMFPKENEQFPELRFPEFTDAWEQRKLGEITENLDNQRIPVAESLRKTGTTPYYGANGIQGYIDGFTHNGEFVLIAEDGANDLQNYPVQYVTGKVWVNNHAHVVAGKINTLDNLFLTYRIKSMDISRFLVGGGRAKLNASTMKEIEIKYPTLPEQTSIGNFFKQLDETIALHQRELEKYKKIKQSYLEKMFV